MKRKIIKQANQAYTITLPIEWVRKNNLNEKSEIDAEDKGRNLILSSGNRIIGEKVKIDINNLGIRDIAVLINSLYARGVDEIEASCEEDIASDLVYVLNQNLGYALVSQKGNLYTIKDISGGRYENLDEIFKRVFQMILLFYESAIKDIFEKEKETQDSLNERDREVNKFCIYLQRAINKQSYPDSVKGHILFTYSYALEQISDEIHRLWSTNINKKVNKTNKLKEAVSVSYEGLGNAFDLYFGFNVKKVREIRKMRVKAREIASSLKLDYATLKLANHAVKICEQASDLSHLTIMMNLS